MSDIGGPMLTTIFHAHTTLLAMDTAKDTSFVNLRITNKHNQHITEFYDTF